MVHSNGTIIYSLSEPGGATIKIERLLNDRKATNTVIEAAGNKTVVTKKFTFKKKC